jgi:Protein of unknown function (DUF998)
MRRAWWRLRAACGVIGPAAFTAAWVTSTVRQTGYSIAEEHLSGLAAPDARDSGIMIAGFVTLGAGIATIAAGLLRRDRMLLHPADAVGGGQSWHNHGHDLASLAIYAALIVAPPRLRRSLRRGPSRRGRRP